MVIPGHRLDRARQRAVDFDREVKAIASPTAGLLYTTRRLLAPVLLILGDLRWQPDSQPLEERLRFGWAESTKPHIGPSHLAALAGQGVLLDLADALMVAPRSYAAQAATAWPVSQHKDRWSCSMSAKCDQSRSSARAWTCRVQRAVLLMRGRCVVAAGPMRRLWTG